MGQHKMDEHKWKHKDKKNELAAKQEKQVSRHSVNLDTVTKQSLIHNDSCSYVQVIKWKSFERLTDVIQRSRAELPIELLGSEPTEITDGVGPQVEDIVPGESLPLLQHHHLSPEQGQFDGRPQPARPGAQDQTLRDGGNDGRYRKRASFENIKQMKEGRKGKKNTVVFKPHRLISVVAMRNTFASFHL